MRNFKGFVSTGDGMKLQILGCAGGIGGREKLTTCFLLDDDILLDAGTGLATLELEQLLAIDHVFITHCHLDHVSGLALLLDAVVGKRSSPVIVHATEQVIATLKTHLFNWLLWPDFAAIPDAENPVLRWEAMATEATIDLNGRLISASAVDHTVDAVAYWVRTNSAGFLFSGDMAATPALWARYCNEKLLTTVVVDCSFPDAEADLARLSRHFCPQALVADIRAMPYAAQFLITHLKPGQEEDIMQELHAHDARRLFTALKRGDVLVFEDGH